MLISVVVRKKSQWINLNFRDYSLIQNLKNLKISFSYFLFNASGTLKTQGIISLLSIYASADLLVMYTALKTLCNASFQIIKTIQNAISPEISKIYIIKLAILKKIFFKLSNLGFWFSVISNIFILLSAKTIITVWSGGKIVVDLEILLLVVIANIFYCYWSNLSTILLATNTHTKFSALYFIVSMTTLTLSYFLISRSYLNWLFAAQILSEIIVTIIFLKISNKYISNYYKFIRGTLRLKF
jgi:O-antigen/teichoic acid export membrane protein